MFEITDQFSKANKVDKTWITFVLTEILFKVGS